MGESLTGKQTCNACSLSMKGCSSGWMRGCVRHFDTTHVHLGFEREGCYRQYDPESIVDKERERKK